MDFQQEKVFKGELERHKIYNAILEMTATHMKRCTC